MTQQTTILLAEGWLGYKPGDIASVTGLDGRTKLVRVVQMNDGHTVTIKGVGLVRRVLLCLKRYYYTVVWLCDDAIEGLSA